MQSKIEKKAQSAIEFVILIGVVIFFIMVFFLVINEKIADKEKEKRDILVEDIATNVQDEINLALKSSDGYMRQFKIPNDIYGQDYKINITDGMVYVRSSDYKHAIALPVPMVIGDVKIGDNIIKRENGMIYLNK